MEAAPLAEMPTIAGATETETPTTPPSTAEVAETDSLTETVIETAGEIDRLFDPHPLPIGNGSHRDEALEVGVAAEAATAVAAVAVERKTLATPRYLTSPK